MDEAGSKDRSKPRPRGPPFSELRAESFSAGPTAALPSGGGTGPAFAKKSFGSGPEMKTLDRRGDAECGRAVGSRSRATHEVSRGSVLIKSKKSSEIPTFLYFPGPDS